MKKQENPIVEVKHTINLAEYDDKEEILSLVAKNGNFGVRAEGDLENIEVGDHVKFININDDKELDIDAKAVKVEEANKVEDVNLQLGRSSIHNILINTLSLFLFAYGKYIDQYILINRAIELQEKLPAEHNAIIKQYVDAGLEVTNAYYSQALLQLRNNYCSTKNCLKCGIGIKLLKQEK